MPKATELVQGTLALLIMRVVAREPLHGWAVAKRIELLSHNALQVQQGSTPFRFSAHLEGHAFVTGELRKQSYGDWEFEVRDPNGYILMFGGDVAIPKLSAGST